MMQGERRGRESGGRWGGLGRSGRESVTRPRIQLRLNVRPPVASSVAPVLCAGSEFSLSVPLPPFLCPCSCTGGKLSFSVRGFVAAQRGLWGPPLIPLLRRPRLCSPRDGVSPGLFPSSGFGCSCKRQPNLFRVGGQHVAQGAWLCPSASWRGTGCPLPSGAEVWASSVSFWAECPSGLYSQPRPL